MESSTFCLTSKHRRHIFGRALNDCVVSAAITGPVSPFFNDDSKPENKNPETLGNALFDNESFEGSIISYIFIQN